MLIKLIYVSWFMIILAYSSVEYYNCIRNEKCFYFVVTLIFYNGALLYCYRINNELVVNLIYTFIFNVTYFYILPELVEFVKDSVRKRASFAFYKRFVRSFLLCHSVGYVNAVIG